MTRGTPEEPELARTLGEIALADAQVDHWLTLAMAELLGIDQGAVSLLIGSDPSDRKAKKAERLIPEGQFRGFVSTLKAVPGLKERRDLAIHSFYTTDGGRLRRHRTRGETPDVTITELVRLRDDIHVLLAGLEAGVQEISVARARSGDFLEPMRDSFEVLAALRIRGHQDFDRLCELADEGREAALVLFGQGRWRLVDPPAEFDDPDAPRPVEAIVVLQPATGRIDVRLRDGRTFAGVDTGWRDVLAQVRTVTPDAQRRFWRRTNDVEQYVADETQWWPLPGLEDRLTSESARDLVQRMQAERATFLPRPEPGRDHRAASVAGTTRRLG